ncbi:MAG: hypothetical protein HYU36_11020 [Planctomycetes bacterium]|nr:hypothetical protein [Planctomycetota bacterium]
MKEVGRQDSEETRRRVLEYLSKRPSAMTIEVARKLEVPEVEVLRAQEGRNCWELRADAFEEVMNELLGMGKCHVFCPNRYAVLESFGEFGGYSITGPYFNVQTGTLDMHIRYEGIASMFCLDKLGHMDRKPAHSVQFYDSEGQAVFKVFLTQHSGDGGYDPKHLEIYENLKRRFGRPSAAES